MRSVVIIAVTLKLALGTALGADPDQVLVLYNADFSADQDGSEPGQDSKEVAEYYVRRHTDQATGKHPYLLGLSCVHGKDHLSSFRVPEESTDNYFGLEYTGGEDPPARWPVADSRYVDILVTEAEVQTLDLNSVAIALGRKPDRAAATVVFEKGEPVNASWLSHGVAEGGGYAWKFNARRFSPGTVHLWFDAKDTHGGEAKSLYQVYHDFARFKVSTTGNDGIRDDKNYLEDIELPVKRFLEDARNALPDGTLLKDHILYIVVCHGLPKAVESMFGVCRGPDGNLGNYGDGSSLQQRLMVLYYDVPGMYFAYVPTLAGMEGRILPGRAKPRFSKEVRPLRRDRNGIQRHIIVNTLTSCLVGHFNPYQHPKTFRLMAAGKLEGLHDQEKYKDPYNCLEPLYPPGSALTLPPRFSSRLRRAWPRQNFLYWAMRVAASRPAIAKAQIDSAVYASRYLTPAMGTCYNRIAGPPPIQPSVRRGVDELKQLGFKLQPQLDKPPEIIERPLIFSAHFGDGPKYYDQGQIVGWNGILPGGIVVAIKSGNGWKRGDDQFGTYFHKMIEAGATVTAGLGAAGGAHITSASWWDDAVLFHHLFRGYQLGECLLMSTIYLDWVTAYVGDPLYQPDVLRGRADTTPPVVGERGITAEVLPAKNCYCAILTVPLHQTPDNPEMAEISAVYAAADQPEQRSCDWRFSARPQVVLRNLPMGATCAYELTLTDPYGNATRVRGSLTVPVDAPSRLRHEEVVAVGEKATPIVLARYWEKGNPPVVASHAGEIEIEFTPRKDDFTLLKVGGLVWRSDKFSIGGGTARTHEPLAFELGRRYRAVARWRRRPVTREVYLIAPDGTEFVAASNNYTPWMPSPQAGERGSIWGTLTFGDRTGDVQVHAVRIVDNADPAPDEHRQPYVRRFRQAEFEARYQRTAQ